MSMRRALSILLNRREFERLSVRRDTPRTPSALMLAFWRLLSTPAAVYDLNLIEARSACRRRADGSIQQLEIEIWDAGPDYDPAQRYWCLVRSDDCKLAAGSGCAAVESAIQSVPWQIFDDYL
jgi:hypothetical protein